MLSDATFTHRLATRADLPVLHTLMTRSIRRLIRAYLDEAGVEASFEIMGVDTQLIDDGTYFVIELDAAIVGCGGWSRRATLFGADHSAGRDARLLDPSTEPARVRAMYTHPDFVRRGIGRLILDLCEDAARGHGFTRVELMGTLAGASLYAACGYEVLERLSDDRGGVAVPLLRMGKAL